MTESKLCARCGTPLPEAGALAARCPRCMAELGLVSTSGFETASLVSAESTASSRPESIGRYRVLRRIGEGGMGVVYEAEQEHPRRTVALKIIKAGMSSPDLLRRFEQETEALARLQHPGIAQIYEAGTADTGFGPQPYFAMELIHGRKPGDYVREHSLNLKQQLELVAKIADAVHHAHQRSLIHRDLKPANILVDETGQPKILDFGVARITDRENQDTFQTNAGQILGTVAYMSPEQVLGDPLDVDTRTDVYALGVILHELLAGRLPYNIGKQVHEAVRVIREEDPERLGAVDRAYRGDIETITLKALEKDKTRRYASAAELAADIRRHLNDEPIVARPPTASYQLRKFARRRRGLVVGAVTVFAILVAATVVSALQANRARMAEQAAVVERDRAAAAGQQARTERNRAIEEQQRADRETAIVKEQRLIAAWQLLSRESSRESATGSDGDLAALLARQALMFHERTPNQARFLVENALQRAAGLHPMRHDLPDSFRDCPSVAFSPDGKHLAAGCADNAVRLWDLRKQKSPRVARVPAVVEAVAFSKDGTRLVLRLRSFLTPEFSVADGLWVWDLTKPGAQVAPVPGSAFFGAVGAFSRDTYAAVLPDGSVEIRELNNLTAQPARYPRPFDAFRRTARIGEAAFSPDGIQLAYVSDRSVAVWNTLRPNTAPLVLTAPLKVSFLETVCFSPDGSQLAATESNTVYVWDLMRPQTPPEEFQSAAGGQIASIAYSPAGDTLTVLTVLKTGSVLKSWPANRTRQTPTELPLNNDSVAIGYSPDGAWLAAAGDKVLVLELSTPATPPLAGPLRGGAAAPETSMTYSRDRTRLAVSIGDSLEVRDLLTVGARPITLKGLPGAVFCLSFSPDNQLLAASIGAEVWLWDLRRPDTPKVVGSVDPLKKLFFPRLDSAQWRTLLAFSPDGSRLAAASSNASGSARGRQDTVWVFDLRKADNALALRTNEFGFGALAFSPDGTYLAAAGNWAAAVAGHLPSVFVWRLQNPAAPARKFRAPYSAVTSLAFSPDGGRVAVTAEYGTTRRVWPHRGAAVVWTWDLRGQNPDFTEYRSKSFVATLAFSWDGARLAATSDTGVELWEVAAPQASAIELGVAANAFSARLSGAPAFSKDGSHFISGTADGRVVAWPLWEAAADYLCTRIWRNLTMDEWRLYVGEDLPYERTCPALPPGTGAP